MDPFPSLSKKANMASSCLRLAYSASNMALPDCCSPAATPAMKAHRKVSRRLVKRLASGGEVYREETLTLLWVAELTACYVLEARCTARGRTIGGLEVVEEGVVVDGALRGRVEARQQQRQQHIPLHAQPRHAHHHLMIQEPKQMNIGVFVVRVP